MNTVFDLSTSEGVLHLTHRNDEFRIVAEGVLAEAAISYLWIARLFIDSDAKHAFGSQDIVEIENHVAPMQHSEAVTRSIFNLVKRTLTLFVGNKSKTYQLTENEWGDLLSHMLES